MKKKRKNNIGRRALSLLLCLCCSVIPLLPTLMLSASAAVTPTVSLEWASGTSLLGGAAVYTGGERIEYKAVLTLSGDADGVVKVRVATFNISADKSDYTSFSKIYELSNTNRSAEITVLPYGSMPAEKNELATRIGDTVYKKQFGIRIDRVENGQKHADKNTLRAQVYSSGATVMSVVKNENAPYYDKVNEAGLLPTGYVYNGVYKTWSQDLSLDDGTADEEASGGGSFNVYDIIDSDSAKTVMSLTPSAKIYFNGNGRIDDKAWKYVGGFTFTIRDANNTSTEYFKGKRTDDMDFDNTYFSWLEFSYDSGGISVGGNSRVTANSRSEDDTFKAIEAKVHDIDVSLYNHSGHAKKYLSSFKTNVFIADTSAPQVVSYKTGTYSYGKNDTVYISVKFDKPVQIDPNGKDIKGNPVKLGLKTLIGDSTVSFEYVDGAYTDTLIFGAKLDKEYVADTIKILEFTNCYSLGNGGVRVMDMMWNLSNQNNLFVAPKGTVSKPIATVNVDIDTRAPVISFYSCDTADKTAREHTVKVNISNISANGSVYYAWSTSNNASDVKNWTQMSFNPSGSNAITGSGYTGNYYLHVKAESVQGQVTLWCSEQSFSFDNNYPKIEAVDCDFPTAASDRHQLTVTVNATDRTKLACVYMYVKDGEGNYLVSQKEVYNRAKASNELTFSENVGTIDVTADGLGLENGDYKWVGIGFEALDIYGNRSPAPVYSSYVLYDNRKDFKAEIEQEPLRELNGYDVYLNNNATYTALFEAQEGGAEVINVYGIFSIKRNGEMIYDISNPDNNGKQAYTLEDLEDYDLAITDVSELLIELFELSGWLDGRTAADEGFGFAFANDDGTRLNITVGEEALGFYEIVYFANGKRAESKLFLTSGADDTENYVNMTENGLLANEVWKFKANKYYSFSVDGGSSSENLSYNINGTAYCNKNSYPIFSSREKAYEYALFMELQDLELVYLDSSMSSVVDMLNGAGSSGTFMKASGETMTASVGQTWIRYKSAAWNPDLTASVQHWVYYHYSNVKETQIDINRIFVAASSTLLGSALEDNSRDICGYDGGYTYLTKNNSAVDSNGQPTYNTDAIFPKDLSYQGDFKEPISFKGDSGIRNNIISYNYGMGVVNDVILVANHTFSASDGATTIYYRIYEGESNTALYQSIRLEKGETAELKSLISASGLYEIIETGAGYRKFCIYADYDVPVLEYEYVRNGVTYTGYIDRMLNGTTVRGSNIKLKRILTTAKDNYHIEYDPQAYVYVTNRAGTSVISFSTLSQLEAFGGVEIPAGNYKLYVYDRLGNYTCVDIRTNADSLEVAGELNSSGDALIVNINRTKDELESFSVTKNGLVYETEYESTLKFYQGGKYVISVSDIYGESITQSFELNREYPSVEFMYKNENGVFVPLGTGSDAGASLEIIDDGVYQIIASTDIRIKYLGGKGYTTTAVSGEPTISKAIMGDFVTVSDADNSGWTVKVALSNDPTTYLLVSCGYDKDAPQISASATLPTYSFNERNGGSNVLFSKLSQTKQLPIESGAKLSCESVSFIWSDQNLIREAYYVKDGVRVNLSEAQFNAQSLTLSGEGEYELFVTDIVNNTASFKLSISKKIALKYLIDGVETAYHENPLSAISGGSFSYTQSTGKQVDFVLGEPMMLTLLYDNGEESGIYELYYDGKNLTVFIYDYTAGVLVANYTTEGGAAFGSLLGSPAYPIAIEYSLDGESATLSIPACESESELIQVRIADEKSSYPYLIQINRSNKNPDVEFVKKGESTPLSFGDGFLGVSSSVEIVPESIDETVSKIIAYYSAAYTTDFADAEMLTLYEGNELLAISDAGYYKIVVENIYGNEQTVYIRIGYEFDISAELTYNSGEKNGYSLGHGVYSLYTNNSARLYVWSMLNDCTVEATMNGAAYTPVFNEQGAGFYIHVSRVGEYKFIIKDFCEHEIEINLSIKAPETISYGDYLDGFNTEALYKDKSYTNAPLNILLEKIKADGIGRIRYVYSQNGALKKETLVYDAVSEKKLELSADAAKGAIGKDGNGVYTVYFMDIYGNEVEKTVYISSAEQLTLNRLTQTDATEQPYSLADAIQRGAWTNRTLILKDTAAASLLKINGNAASFTDGAYRFDFPVNIGQGHEIYTVEYLDEYGNKYTFTVNLYRKAPEVSLTEGVSTAEVNESVYVRGEFGYIWSDPNVSASYTLGGESIAYLSGQKLSGEGRYVFTFTDLAGNSTVRTLIYDTVVAYKLIQDLNEVSSGIATNGSIIIKNDGEDIKIVAAMRDGKEYPTDSMTFKEHGYYELTLGDAVGNTAVVRFYIITHAFNDFTYTAESGYGITDVWFTVDGFRLSYVGDVVIDENGRQSYRLTEVGEYELAITDTALGRAYTFKVTIDRTPPAATLVGVENGGITREKVTLNGVEVGDLVEVYRDGELIFSQRATSKVVDPPMIESSGDFRIVVTDEAGNSVEFTFQKQFATNLASNVIILMIMLLAVAGAMIYLFLGKKVRVK